MDLHLPDTRPELALRIIKIVHTVVWAIFAGCILLIIPFAWAKNFAAVAFLVGLVLIEVAILVVNDLRCPLTAVAGRYTEDRADNFDIYLPLRVARYNKQIFGSLFIVSLVFALASWFGWV